MAKQERQERKIAQGQSVFHGGRFYAPGDEDALHEAGLEKADVARLTNAGVISGFGAKAVDEESLAADPTIKAGEVDEAPDESGAAATPALSEVVHQPGRNAPTAGKRK